MSTCAKDDAILNLPYLLTVDNRVEEVNEPFLSLAGYGARDFLGKKVEEVWRPLLRINADPGTVKNSGACSCYMFDSNREVKDVVIKYSYTQKSGIYTFQQKKNSILEDKFPFLELVNSSNDTGLAICSVPDFILLKANKSYHEYLGDLFSVPKDMLGISLEESVPDWENSQYYETFMSAVRSGKPAFFSEMLMSPPGADRICTRATITPIYEDGILKYIILIHNDVTEKVMNREELLEKNKIIERQKNRLEAILETVSKSIVLCVFDKHGRFIDGNSLAENCFTHFKTIRDLKEASEAGMYYDESGNELSFEELPINRVLEGKNVSGYKLAIKHKGEVKHYIVNGTPIFDNQGDYIMGLICGWDITERIKYQQLLEKQRDYLLKVFNSLDLPIIHMTYPDLRVIELNKKVIAELKEVAGPNEDIIASNIIGKKLPEILPVIKKYNDRPFFEKLDMTKSTICHEKMEIIKEGCKAYYNIIYHPILNMEGDISELLMSAVDVTGEVEKNMHMEEVLKLKDDFLYLMSHEFKTPLTVINAAVQILEQVYDNQIPVKAMGLVKKIKQNTYRQLRLVNNLLDITRINAGQIKLKWRNMDIVNLTRVITESVAIYAQQKGVEISFRSRLEYKVIGMDDEKFERILLNLLSNAIKFTPAGKKVVVELYSKLYKNKRMVCITVKDEGIGIPKDKHNVVFERFGQVDSLLARQAEGNGIGLFLVKLIVNALNGEILLESEEGKGSVFTLLIPAKKVRKPAEESAKPRFSDSRLIQSVATEFSDIYL